MLYYHLGMMKSADGRPLRIEVEAEASRCAQRITDAIEALPVFTMLGQRLPSPRLPVYFQFVVKNEIFSFVRDALVIRWYKRNGKSVPGGLDRIFAPRSGIFPLLHKVWCIDDVPIVLKNDVLFYASHSTLLTQLMRSRVKKYVNWIERALYTLRAGGKPLYKNLGDGGLIACHHAEGIDPLRRTDLNWFYSSEIQAKKVLIYFNLMDNATSGKDPVGRDIIEKIERLGMKWVVLKKGVVENGNSHYWDAPAVPASFLLEENIVHTSVDKWTVRKSNELLEKVHYWRSFYDYFNIKLQYVPEEGMVENIIQAIAFDMDDRKKGALVGKQLRLLVLGARVSNV